MGGALNGYADRLAKQGAALHSISEQVVGDYFGLMHLVCAAATWAGIHEAWLADEQRYDAQSIEGMKDKGKHQPAPVPSSRAAEREEQVMSHQLVVADVQPRSEGWIIAYTVCGAFAWKRRGKLLSACPRRPTSVYMRQQLERLRNFQFPGESPAYAVSAPRQPKREELDWLVKYDRAPQGTSAVAEALEVKSQLFRTLDRSSLLREFGINTAEELAWWNQAAAAAKVEDSSDLESSDED